MYLEGGPLSELFPMDKLVGAIPPQKIAKILGNGMNVLMAAIVVSISLMASKKQSMYIQEGRDQIKNKRHKERANDGNNERKIERTQ